MPQHLPKGLLHLFWTLTTLWEISGFFCKLDELEYWNIISNTVGILIITYGGMRIVTFSSSINAT